MIVIDHNKVMGQIFVKKRKKKIINQKNVFFICDALPIGECTELIG